jgi:hypothetical protein
MNLFRRNLAVWSYSFALFLFAMCAPAQVTVQIGQNFTGSTYGVNSSALPPDPNGAIGPKYFVEFINGTVAVYNPINGLSVQRKSNLKFWSDAGLIISPDADVTDPRVIYDSLSQRWFASQVDFDATAAANGLDYTLEANDFLFAVSAGSDPTGPWNGFLFQADPDNGDFADFPTMGVDSNAVYLSGDMFHGQTNAVGAALVSIPKADLLTSTPTITNRTWFGVMSYTNRGQVLQPVTCFDGSSSGAILAVGDVGADGNFHSNLVSFAVQNAGGPSATLTTSTSISISQYLVPFNSVNVDPPQGLFTVLQPDGTTTLAGNDARLSARVYAVAGVIYAVHNTELNGRMAIRWYRISATNDTLLESGTIADTNLDLFFPAIAANANGTVVIGCNGSGMDTFVSCYAIAGQTVKGVTTFGPLLLLQYGGTSYHGDDEILEELYGQPQLSRWGDYNTVSVDPADPTRFWSIQMFPPPSDFSDVWSTQITELLTSQLLPQMSIAPAGTNVMVSWPSIVTGFQLESATSLAPPIAWSNVTNTASTNGGTISVLVPISGSQTFFRLQQ